MHHYWLSRLSICLILSLLHQILSSSKGIHLLKLILENLLHLWWKLLIHVYVSLQKWLWILLTNISLYLPWWWLLLLLDKESFIITHNNRTFIVHLHLKILLRNLLLNLLLFHTEISRLLCLKHTKLIIKENIFVHLFLQWT